MQYSSIYLFSHSKGSFNSRTEKEIYILYSIRVSFIPTKYQRNRKRSSKGKDIMKFFDCFFQKNDPFYLTDGANKQLIKKQKKKRVLLFETSRDLQPILRFNIITRRKRYSLFPVLSGLIEPSLRNFRIALSNGLFSPVGIGGSIPSLRTVLESFLPHTAQHSILVVSHFFYLPYLIEWDFS